jgi:predicted nucleotide-binding protein
MKITIIKKFKPVFWFSIGILLGIFLFASFAFIVFQKKYSNVVYPKITVEATNLGGKTEKDVIDFFTDKNTIIQDSQFIFFSNENIATVSAKEIDYGYDENLIANQSIAIGRSKDIFSNISLITQSYFRGIDLPPAYH